MVEVHFRGATLFRIWGNLFVIPSAVEESLIIASASENVNQETDESGNAPI